MNLSFRASLISGPSLGWYPARTRPDCLIIQ